MAEQKPVLEIVLNSDKANKQLEELGNTARKISRDTQNTAAGTLRAGGGIERLTAAQAQTPEGLGAVLGAGGGPVGSFIGGQVMSLIQPLINNIKQDISVATDWFGDKLLEQAGLWERTGDETVSALRNMSEAASDVAISEQERLKASKSLLKIEQDRARIQTTRGHLQQFAQGAKMRPGESREDFARRAQVWMGPKLRRYDANVREQNILFEEFGVQQTAEERAGMRFWERDTLERNREAMANLQGER